MSGPSPAVAELQGLYGPFAFPEILLQKLWWRREFAAGGARTADGGPIVVHSPGRWNRLGGPDFRDAVIEIDGVRIRGDVEVHLRAEEWNHHGHTADRAYARVVLHVVLFPPREAFTRGAEGSVIPILALLPLLWHDLEEYAADEAIATLLNRAEHQVAAELVALTAPDLASCLREHGVRRWKEKVRFAARRIVRLGWEEACHQTALEILGYRMNRAGMLRVAAEWPLMAWASGAVEPDRVFDAQRDVWALQGVRPANHPRHRLRQYAAWSRARPEWPQWLVAWSGSIAGAPLATVADPTVTARRGLLFPAAWSALLEAVCDGAVAGPRADNLMGDGFLPLLAARAELCDSAALAWWWHGYPGDLPDPVRRALRELGIGGAGGASPVAAGPAQGLLGWLLERESLQTGSAVLTAGPGA